VGLDIADLALPWTVEPILAALDAAMQRRESTRLDAIPVRTSTGMPRYLALGVSPMVDRHDQLRGCLILGRDVTQQRALELQLQQAQKLESIGQLAAGIAHEINTPTQFINDNTRFVRESFAELAPLLDCCRALAEDSTNEATIGTLREALAKTDLAYLAEEVPRALEESLGGIARVASIVKAMKQFSHPGNSELECVNLNQALESTVTVARNEWKYVAEMELDLAPDLPLVPCYPGELNQAVLNMIVNAAHAIGDVVKLSPGALGRIRIQTKFDDNAVQIRISDTGAGIPEAIRQRIFDPFFTTKEVGKGTGQGLAIARSVVVDKHKGRIEVESEVGKGTTFLIEIPLQEQAEADAEPRAPERIPA
jgi:signal transduction histidine kinase